jgi:hypothetical protein
VTVFLGLVEMGVEGTAMRSMANSVLESAVAAGAVVDEAYTGGQLTDVAFIFKFMTVCHVRLQRCYSLCG